MDTLHAITQDISGDTQAMNDGTQAIKKFLKTREFVGMACVTALLRVHTQLP